MTARAKIRKESLVHRHARNLLTPQAIEMLTAFERTGRVESLIAAQRHVNGILRRLGNESDGGK